MSSPTNRYAISKQKPLNIYNGVSENETNDTYIVKWYAFIGTEESTDGLVLKETKDEGEQVTDTFIKTNGSLESMEGISKNVGIYFSNAKNLLGENGWIKVYDEETDELLLTVEGNDLDKYTSSNPYTYEKPVKNIRVQTSETTNNKSIYVYNIKEIDDGALVNKYIKEQFDNLQYIQSNLEVYIGETHKTTKESKANYEMPISMAEFSISENTLSTQITEEHNIIKISTKYLNNNNQAKWKNGTFLVKIPNEILTTEINEVTIDNNEVQIINYGVITNESGKFIKINTQNNTPQTYTITIDVNLSPDPRIPTTTKQVELFASNEEITDYYYRGQDTYDVNDNLNTSEIVNYRSISLSMVSPNSLLTNQVATNYDDKASTIVSPQIADIKPNYAIVDQEEQIAQIGVQLRNNYASTISEIQILGKIPFEGNT